MQDPRSVERLRRGDVSTLKRLFKANHAKLYPLAYRLTRSREGAGLVIRKSFARLWDERAQLDVFEPLDIRLVQRVYAEALEYRAENGITGFAVEPERLHGNGRGAEVDLIPPDDRLNYLLFIVDGYSFRELALAFGSSVEDIQLSIGRALTALKELPESYDQ